MELHRTAQNCTELHRTVVDCSRLLVATRVFQRIPADTWSYLEILQAARGYSSSLGIAQDCWGLLENIRNSSGVLRGHPGMLRTVKNYSELFGTSARTVRNSSELLGCVLGILGSACDWTVVNHCELLATARNCSVLCGGTRN